MKQIKNLVFSGSGSKIFMHIGFVKYLVENKLFSNINTFIGTSGGAIMSTILAIGYNLDIISELFLKLKYEQLEKIDTYSVLNFFDTYGIDSGENMERVLRIMLKNKLGSTHLTFKELYEKTGNSLVVCSTNINKHKEVFFDKKNYPDLDVIEATLMSLSIPLLFVPRKYNNDMYVDGGIMCHYPIEYIENNDLDINETIGFVIVPDYYMCSSNICDQLDKPPANISTFESFIFNVIGCSMIKNLKRDYEKHKDITVLAINNKNSFDFFISNESKEEYILNAYNYTSEFFAKKLDDYNKNDLDKDLNNNNDENIDNDLNTVNDKNIEKDLNTLNDENIDNDLNTDLNTEKDLNFEDNLDTINENNINIENVIISVTNN